MSTREIAILIWIIISAVCLYFYDSKITKPIMRILEMFINFLKKPIVLMIITINTFYIVLLYYLFNNYNYDLIFWFLKDYIIVLVSSLIPVFKMLEKINIRKLFMYNISSLLAFVTLPNFILSEYTFNILIELLLVPILFLIGAVLSCLKTIKAQNILNMFNILWSLLLVLLLTNSIRIFIININDVTSAAFWISFFLELLIWIINIPVLLIYKYMLRIEHKAQSTKYGNKLRSYYLVMIHHFTQSIRFLKYFKKKPLLKEKISDANETSFHQGGKIQITLSDVAINNEEALYIIVDAIIGRDYYTKLTDKKYQYPSLVRIVNNKFKPLYIWQYPLIPKPKSHIWFKKHEKDLIINSIYKIL